MKSPAVEATVAIVEVLQEGSHKDGSEEGWRQKEAVYHLTKAQAHLATHIKQLFDSRTQDGEDHLKLALCRIAMVLAL